MWMMTSHSLSDHLDRDKHLFPDGVNFFLPGPRLHRNGEAAVGTNKDACGRWKGQWALYYPLDFCSIVKKMGGATVRA
jgi:hypothetical protein